jgi:hypothetical protein
MKTINVFLFEVPVGANLKQKFILISNGEKEKAFVTCPKEDVFKNIVNNTFQLKKYFQENNVSPKEISIELQPLAEEILLKTTPPKDEEIKNLWDKINQFKVLNN